MKFVKDVDSGEIFSIDDNIEQNIDVPAFVDDNFPEMKVDYSGKDGANDIILDLTHQLNDEKNSKTVYHKFPIMKILLAVMVSAVVAVVGVFGVRFVNSINFEPVTIEYSKNTEYSENINNSDETNEEEQQNEEPKAEEKSFLESNLDSLSSMLPVISAVFLCISGIKLCILFLKDSIRP